MKTDLGGYSARRTVQQRAVVNDDAGYARSVNLAGSYATLYRTDVKPDSLADDAPFAPAQLNILNQRRRLMRAERVRARMHTRNAILPAPHLRADHVENSVRALSLDLEKRRTQLDVAHSRLTMTRSGLEDRLYVDGETSACGEYLFVSSRQIGEEVVEHYRNTHGVELLINPIDGFFGRQFPPSGDDAKDTTDVLPVTPLPPRVCLNWEEVLAGQPPFGQLAPPYTVRAITDDPIHHRYSGHLFRGCSTQWLLSLCGDVVLRKLSPSGAALRDPLVSSHFFHCEDLKVVYEHVVCIIEGANGRSFRWEQIEEDDEDECEILMQKLHASRVRYEG
eukprot:GEMP01042084.1.p1 GENE.GEMP01042084.1~~GEMP01042084.1.p1  ORF type:complete len:335 (+),score=91.52 GEMP01042084.1:140-1144(+)